MTISIITATYNSAATIADTLQSVLQQTYQDFEVIVVDGVSSDNTLEIIRSFEPAFQGKLRIVSEPDQGLYDAMNKGLHLAIGQVVGILNSDDFFSTPHSLEYIAQAFADPTINACYGNLYFVQPHALDVPIRHYTAGHFRPWMMRLGYAPPHPTFYCRKEVYEQHPLFDLNMKIAADFELMLRLIYVQRLTTVHIPHNLVTMRMGGVSTAGWRSYLQGLKDRLRALKKNKVYSNFFFLSLPYCYKACQMITSRFKR